MTKRIQLPADFSGVLHALLRTPPPPAGDPSTRKAVPKRKRATPKKKKAAQR